MLVPLLIEGTEWIIIGVIIVALLVFGPEKIPELAKSIGKAKGEFDKASREATSVVNMAMKSIDEQAKETTSQFKVSAPSPSLPSPPAPPASLPAGGTPAVQVPGTDASDPLIELAHKLGISTEGKTKEEISQAILQKAGDQSQGKSPP